MHWKLHRKNKITITYKLNMNTNHMSSKSFRCKDCGMVFVNAIELFKHEINVHVDNSYQCQSCNKVFRNSKEFNEHIEAHSSL